MPVPQHHLPIGYTSGLTQSDRVPIRVRHHRWPFLRRTPPDAVTQSTGPSQAGALTAHFRRLVVALIGVVATVVVGPTVAYAAPTNDDFGGATAIASLPYTTTQDTSDATSDPSDPASCYNRGSVWFSYTAPADSLIEANTAGSGYDTVLSAWTGTQGSLTMLACNDDYNGSQSQISFSATTGTTYYIMVAQCCGYDGSGGGSLQLSVNQTVPAGNDAFADATRVSGLPYTDSVNLNTTGMEAGEPTSCFTPTNTAWYAYTATATESITATTSEFDGAIAAYTGSTISDLTAVGCRDQASQQGVTFRAQAGTTYYFQVGARYGYTGVIHFNIAVSPQVLVAFGYFPYYPSAYDTVEFFDQSWDPGGAGIASWVWDFGDGATATGIAGPRHRYAADGDYTVTLTVTTTDGRTGMASTALSIRTHDVSIERIDVPATARGGQTIGVNVYVRNAHYTENVEVSLFRSGPNGYAHVSSSTRKVMVSPTGKTTRFSFKYTVTSDDVAIGSVSFKAVAMIVDHLDALPADNELISSPVKLS
jgi:PKD repeat protein